MKLVKITGKKSVSGRMSWSASGPGGFSLLAIFMVLALGLGGAGEHYPLTAGVVGLSALGLAAGCRHLLWQPVRSAGEKAALLLLGLLFALILAQIVPLPGHLVAAMPGRALVTQMDAAMGWSVWRPLSMTPDLTLDIMVALVPSALTFLIMRAASMRQRMAAVRSVTGFSLFAALLGILQVAAGADAALFPWESAHQGLGIGLFVNRNHQAALLLVAIVLAGVKGAIPAERWFRGRGGMALRFLVGSVLAILAGGVLATLSRTGLALLPLALAMAGGLRLKGQGRLWGLLALLALLAGGALMGVGLASQAFARFDLVGQDSRWQYWQNSWLLLREVWPWGAGFGSFIGLYQQVEPLNEVVPLFVNHAHNDMLEWVMEGGLACLLLLLAGLILYGRALIAALFAHMRGEQALALAGGGGCLLLLLCSVTDFPLRMTALGVVFALCSALLLSEPLPTADQAAPPPPRLRLIGAGLAGAVMAALMVVCAVSQSALLAGNWSTALQWAPWRAQGWALGAQEALRHGHRGEAMQAARQALRIEPLNVMAVRTMGMASDMAGDKPRAAALLAVTGALGWRDGPAQVWLATQAEALGNRDYEVMRVDALLRQHVMEDQAMTFLTNVTMQADGAQAVIERLKDQPGWRQGFLNHYADQAALEPAMAVWFVDRANRHGAHLTSAELNLVIWRMAEAGAYAEARHVWMAGGGQGLIGNGDFRGLNGRLPEQGGPFHWRSPQQTSFQAFGETDGGQQAVGLRIASDGRMAGTPLAQTVLLPAGHYRLRVWLDKRQGHAPLPGWSVTCLPTGPQTVRQDVPLAWKDDSRGLLGEGVFSVPQGCEAQDLAMQVAANNFQDFQIALQRVAVDYVK